MMWRFDRFGDAAALLATDDGTAFPGETSLPAADEP